MVAGMQDAAEATIETLRAIEHPLSRSAQIIVDVCAYAGTGNVLKVQEMLHICGEHAEKPKKPSAEGAAAAAEGETPDPASATGTSAAAEPGLGVPGVGPDADVEMDGEGADGTTTGTTGGAGGPNAQAPLGLPLGMGAGAAPAAAAGAGPDEDDEEGEPKALKHQAFATVGIALIAMGEEVGAEMALRQFQHLVSLRSLRCNRRQGKRRRRRTEG